jgi:hypothetical protein
MRFNVFLAAAAVANAAVIPQIPQPKDAVNDVTSGVKSTVDGVTLPKVNAHVGRRAQANVGAKVDALGLKAEPKVGVALGRRVDAQVGTKVNVEGVTYDNVNVTVGKSVGAKVGANVNAPGLNVDPKVNANVGRSVDANVDAKVNALGVDVDASIDAGLNRRQIPEVKVPEVNGLAGDVTSGVKSTVNVSPISVSLGSSS